MCFLVFFWSRRIKEHFQNLEENLEQVSSNIRLRKVDIFQKKINFIPLIKYLTFFNFSSILTEQRKSRKYLQENSNLHFQERGMNNLYKQIVKCQNAKTSMITSFYARCKWYYQKRLCSKKRNIIKLWRENNYIFAYILKQIFGQKLIRKREVLISRVSIYIVIIIVTCHSIREARVFKCYAQRLKISIYLEPIIMQFSNLTRVQVDHHVARQKLLSLKRLIPSVWEIVETIRNSGRISEVWIKIK